MYLLIKEFSLNLNGQEGTMELVGIYLDCKIYVSIG